MPNDLELNQNNISRSLHALSCFHDLVQTVAFNLQKYGYIIHALINLSSLSS